MSISVGTFYSLELYYRLSWKSFNFTWGPEWLSGRVLESRPRGRGFEPQRRYCVVVLEQDTFNQLSTGSTEEDPSLFN